MSGKNTKDRRDAMPVKLSEADYKALAEGIKVERKREHVRGIRSTWVAYAAVDNAGQNRAGAAAG